MCVRASEPSFFDHARNSDPLDNSSYLRRKLIIRESSELSCIKRQGTLLMTYMYSTKILKGTDK